MDDDSTTRNVTIFPLVATAVLLVTSLVALGFEVAPPDLIGVILNLMFLALSVLTLQDVLKGFASPHVLVLAPLFILATAVQATGVLQPLLRFILGPPVPLCRAGSSTSAESKSLKSNREGTGISMGTGTGTGTGMSRVSVRSPPNTSWILFKFLVPVSFTSAFMNNTPIVAITCPALLTWCLEVRLDAPPRCDDVWESMGGGRDPSTAARGSTESRHDIDGRGHGRPTYYPVTHTHTHTHCSPSARLPPSSCPYPSRRSWGER
jgi:hypothetical protein